MADGYLPLPGGIGPAQPFPRLNATAAEAASGGSVATVTVTATGAGEIGVLVSGGGRTFEAVGTFRLKPLIRKKGGSVAHVAVLTDGAGVKATAGGSIAARIVALSTTGAGVKRARGASVVAASIRAAGDGFGDDPDLLLRLYASSLLHIRRPAA